MFKKILLPIDPSDPAFAKGAFETALRFAQDYGASLHLVAVCAEVQSFVSRQLPEDFQSREIEQTQTVLDTIVRESGFPRDKLTTEVRVGTVYHEVIAAAQETGSDLVLIHSHKPRMVTYFIGSNAAQIVRHAPCSVMVLRD